MDRNQLSSNFISDYPLSVASSTLMVRETAKRAQSVPGLRNRLTNLVALATSMLDAVEQANVPDNQLFQLENFVINAHAALLAIQRRVHDEAANASVVRPEPPTPGLANAKATFPPGVEAVRATPVYRRRVRSVGQDTLAPTASTSSKEAA